MASKAELLALADRCGREEPSRNLDGDIALATGWTTRMMGGAQPAFTRSLDAAVTLVPGGCIWDVCSTGWTWCMDDRNEHTIGRCKTPALGLCAAALRAIAATKGE